MKTLQLTAEAGRADWAAGSKALRPLRGKVVVEMDPPPTMFRGLLVPQDMEYDLWPDTGTVLAVGEPLDGQALDLYPGERVICHPDDGKWMEDAVFGSYRASCRVRMFGLTQNGLTVERLAWDESVVARLEGKMIVPTGSNVLIRRDPVVTVSSGGVLIDAESQERPQTATVVAVGSGCSEVKPSDRVVYWSGGRLDFYWAGDEDLAMVRERDILTRVEG
jgi:co-chaperonin GroES (HSP10)